VLALHLTLLLAIEFDGFLFWFGYVNGMGYRKVKVAMYGVLHISVVKRMFYTYL